MELNQEISEKNNNYQTYDTFESMPLKENLLRGILAYGYEKPSAVQSKGIIPVINGQDSIIQAQSGTGKTATFTIASLEKINPEIKSCQVIVLNPTREIADQSLIVMKSIGSYLNFSFSGVIGGKKLSNDEVSKSQIIVGTPGRVYDMISKGVINMQTLSLFVLDEADAMLAKGFQEQIIEIFKYVPDHSQVAVYSATMPTDILSLTKQIMKNPIEILVKKESLTLEGIKQFFLGIETEQDKYLTLLDLFSCISMGQCILYCSSKKKVSWLTEKLESSGYPISSIHGDVTQTERDEIMRNFRKCNARILITTDLLSRGIDVQQVSLVINYDLPRDKESYLHRIGRTGRYGRKGCAINFIMSEYDIRNMQEIEKYYGTQITELPANISDLI